MPDLAAMMQNPMMMQMAQQMMANGGMDRMMQNPAVANMVSRPSGREICIFGSARLILRVLNRNR